MIEQGLSLANFREMEEEDLGLVLSWRNHPDIRRYMYNQHEIMIDEHRQWFEQNKADLSSFLLIFETTAPLGFVSFKKLGSCVEWGFYTAPDAPKGTGTLLGEAALQYAFEEIKVHKVCGQALDYNQASKRLHQKIGFKHEGVLREQYFDGQCYHDIICFGILQYEWNMRCEKSV